MAPHARTVVACLANCPCFSAGDVAPDLHSDCHVITTYLDASDSRALLRALRAAHEGMNRDRETCPERPDANTSATLDPCAAGAVAAAADGDAGRSAGCPVAAGDRWSGRANQLRA